MNAYPIEPAKLLKRAYRLAPKRAKRGRPSYTAHRRAVSTAYYAVFHAIAARVSQAVFPSADVSLQQGVSRWIAHTDILAVAWWVRQVEGTRPGSPPDHIRQVLDPSGGAHLDGDVSAIAEGFDALHRRRQEADYDHAAVFARGETLRLIALADDLVTRTELVGSLGSEVLFGLIAMRAQIRSR